MIRTLLAIALVASACSEPRTFRATNDRGDVIEGVIEESDDGDNDCKPGHFCGSTYEKNTGIARMLFGPNATLCSDDGNEVSGPWWICGGGANK